MHFSQGLPDGSEFDVYKGGLETGLSICNRITRPVTVELVKGHAVAVKRIRRSPKGISDLGLCFG